MTTDLSRGTGPAAEPEYRTATGMLRRWAQETPDAPWLTQDLTTLTWSEGYASAVRASAALAERGVVAGDRVAFLDRNCIEYFEFFFGCAL
ncbi:MAG TPA: AMP-binding protein, partial [Acidimicrobiales bacterium]|nr:AMP-binding protein [Acidimicrobiales bacterium]